MSDSVEENEVRETDVRPIEEAVSENTEPDNEPAPKSEPTPEGETVSENETTLESESASENEPVSECEPDSECDPAAEPKSEPAAEPEKESTKEPTVESEPSPASVITQVVIDPAIIDEFAAKIKSLESLFSKRLAYDDVKERILDKLHGELQDHKSDLYFKLTKPVFLDVIVVLDDIRKIRESLDLEKQKECDSILDSVSESLVYMLDKYEVLPFSSEPGSKFEAVKQRMIRTKDTDDDAQVATLAQSVFTGFMYKDQLVSPEKVVVYKKSKKAEEN